MGAISETGKRYSRLTLEHRSSEDGLLWVSRLADLKKDVSQGVLLVRLESNMEIDRGAVWRGTQADPVVRDGVPLMFYNHIAPRCRDSEGHSGTSEEGGNKDREHRESEVAHTVIAERPLEVRGPQGRVPGCATEFLCATQRQRPRIED